MKVVILPGLDGTGQLLLDFCAALSRSHEPILFRFPSHLSSYRDLTTWIRPQLPDSDFLILGESFSGPLAILLAASNPPGLRGVVLAASFVRPPRKLPPGVSVLAKVLPLSFRPLTWLAQPFLMGRYGTPNLANMFRNVVASVPRGTIAERLREALQTDVTSIAHTLDYPMASLQAEQDRLVPTRAALPCPPGMMVRIQGPHFLLQTRARECAVEVAKLAADWGRADAAEQI